ncbi:histidinol phosphatase (plasmid) [Azospirillum argentinense]|uniref:Histidinol phosphatase n=1 Tax=Azospirillum argentinense TaxID=2970906 RepID=A0A060DMH4_9PROT|nr:AAA family ATPase [Azospirillum argentinense]AIB13945.1 histidinol phosphatase [Azospirillum argentinense]EZQ05780.1 histidinol phosphatase [Azospirillum argentinense]
MVVDTVTAHSNGATFFRGDLHIHSFGASYDVTDSDATPANIVEVAVKEGLAFAALADHNEITNVREAVDLGAAKGLLVIPAVELSTPEGHLLCYAPTPDALERFFNHLSIAERRTPNCRCQTGVFQCLDLLGGEGGFAVLAHVELAGAFEANLPRFTPAKLDILCHPSLLAIEVTRVDCPVLYTDRDTDNDRRAAANERIQRLRLGSQQFLARIFNSDAHTLVAVGRNAQSNRRITRYKMEAPSFEGLRLALMSADTRVRIEDEVPSSVPWVQGVHFQGGFLDGEAINFSPNLTCIIGGRGSGKSTTFESVCLLRGASSVAEIPVIDSDVWPDVVSVVYRDETAQSHVLARSKFGDVENVDDPMTGPIAFPIESYRQGEANEISKRVQDNPLALLTFLDRLIAVEQAIAEEDVAREQLIDLAPKVDKARINVDKIPDYEKELKLKQDQLARLRKDKGEDVIKLQQRLEGEKRARNTIELALGKLNGAISSEAVTSITGTIKASVSDGLIEVGAPEAAQIKGNTTSYEVAVAGSTTALRQVTAAYVAGVRAQIATWKAKEGQTSAAIETKKKELLQVGIRLDMPFIQKLVADEAKAGENVKNLKTWIPELARLRKEYAELLRQRWAARERVATIRTAFAARASNALKSTLSDLFVTLKFDPSSLSPDAERLIIDAMGWRTLQQVKAGALITKLTLPVLLDCIRRKTHKPITALRNDANAPVFAQNEAEMLIERLAEPNLLSQLETVAVYDRPRLSVTKRIDVPGEAPKFIPRDFKRLSLGQQQSVLLALMLTSESCAPLIVDQPEDNLDSEFIYKTLVPVIRAAKERRQVIVVTHNANIAVLGDAELIVVLKATNEKATITTRGSIDQPDTREATCATLEGSREAFDRRAAIYGVIGSQRGR